MTDPIVVDPRVGSKELVTPLRTLGAPVEIATLDAGDFKITGSSNDEPVVVLIERKTVSDLLACIADKRFAVNQLPGLSQADVAYLLIEGPLKRGNEGELVQYNGRNGWRYRSVASWIFKVEHHGGIRVVNTPNLWTTAAWLHALHRWWTEGEDRHKHALPTSVKQWQRVDLVPPDAVELKRRERARFASCMPGVGDERADTVSRHFNSIAEMVAADEKEWMKVPGIGKGVARKIVKWVWEGYQ